MGKLVDADVLMEWVFNWFEKHKYYHPYSKSNEIPIAELKDILDNIPSVEPDSYGHHPKMEQIEPPADVQSSQVAREILQIIINKRRNKMAKYAYVRVPADGYPEIVDKEDKCISWKETSDVVGGHIEIVKSADRDLWIVCNDEGKLRDLPVNSFATQLYGIPEDYIAGDVIICGQGTNRDGEPDIIPLPIDIAVDVWSKAYVSYQGVRIWQLLHSSSTN